jgi:hypothetical protein
MQSDNLEAPYQKNRSETVYYQSENHINAKFKLRVQQVEIRNVV